MKRIALLFAFLFTFSTAFISCRDTENKNDDVELDDDMDDLEDEMEDAADEIEDEID